MVLAMSIYLAAQLVTQNTHLPHPTKIIQYGTFKPIKSFIRDIWTLNILLQYTTVFFIVVILINIYFYLQAKDLLLDYHMPDDLLKTTNFKYLNVANGIVSAWEIVKHFRDIIFRRSTSMRKNWSNEADFFTWFHLFQS